MLRDYRRWLEDENKLLGNASHHAYAFGQANMAKRAIERLDADLADTVPLVLGRAQAQAALEKLGGPNGGEPASEAVGVLRAALAAALA